MAEKKEEVDYYTVVGVSNTADSNEIKTAYRKASLKVHPDRNPDDPQAAEKFHLLNTAFEILLDPIKRSEFDSKRQIKIARAARFEGLDSRRKELSRELEERERAFEDQRKNEDDKKLAKARKIDEIKAAGARMRQAREEDLNSKNIQEKSKKSSTKLEGDDESSKKQSSKSFNANNQSSSSKTSEELQPELDPLDCTLKFKWSRRLFPDLIDSDSLSSKIISTGVIAPDEIESVILSSKSLNSNTNNPSSKPDDVLQDGSSGNKKVSAVVCFKSIKSCMKFLEFVSTEPKWSKISVTQIKK